MRVPQRQGSLDSLATAYVGTQAEWRQPGPLVSCSQPRAHNPCLAPSSVACAWALGVVEDLAKAAAGSRLSRVRRLIADASARHVQVKQFFQCLIFRNFCRPDIGSGYRGVKIMMRID